MSSVMLLEIWLQEYKEVVVIWLKCCKENSNFGDRTCWKEPNC